jgi:hypothetical protein
MSHLLLNQPHGYSLLLMRRHAGAGLLRDGGVTVAQVCRYVQEMRCEVEHEVDLRIGKYAPTENWHSGGSEDGGQFGR